MATATMDSGDDGDIITDQSSPYRTLIATHGLGTGTSFSMYFPWEVRRVSDNVLVSSGTYSASGGNLTNPVPATFQVGTLPDGYFKVRGLAGYVQDLADPYPVDNFAATSYQNFTIDVNRPPTATLVSPAKDSFPGTLTPSLVLNFTDPDSGTNGDFSAYQIQVQRNSDSVVFWDTGQLAATSGEKAAKQVTKTYAGTTLVSGTMYKWRARVQDFAGEWSEYAVWNEFTPSLNPNPPTSLLPSGLQNTLTPTISGVYNQGNGSTETDFQYEIKQNAVVIYNSGDATPNIATGQVYGSDNAGDTPSTPPTLAWGNSYQIRARSKDALSAYSDWTSWQNFNTNAAPTTPTSLNPATGAVTGDTTPTLSWVHNDADADAQTAVEIDLYNLSTSTYVTGYNSKALTQATLTHDVTQTLTQPHNYQWRIRTKGTAGPEFGPWSDWATFTDANGPTVTMTAPTVDQVLIVSSIAVSWTFSGGSGVQQDYQVKLFAVDQSTLLYDSGVIAGTGLSANIPSGYVRNGLSYYVQVVVRDTLSQTASTSLRPVQADFEGPPTITGTSLTIIGNQVE